MNFPSINAYIAVFSVISLQSCCAVLPRQAQGTPRDVASLALKAVTEGLIAGGLPLPGMITGDVQHGLEAGGL
ncbi:putative signal peptide protein [Puccinia sorghi]|uniref:Putative signal peptide protein n=1 Tax=Puccinia sorghi TaxID=27349 RepID=A0A0L6V2R9_9BASI|nr:putative signal peptide protein [Puccinia sorghi]